MSIKAMKQALEALEHSHANEPMWKTPIRNAITALRTAIEQAEKKDAWKNAAMRIGEELSSVGPDGYYNMTAEKWLNWAMDQQPRGKNSLPQPQQAFESTCSETLRAQGKPYQRTCKKCGLGPCIGKPRHEWVGLTNDEITDCWEQIGRGLEKYATFAKAIEAKLKEKNT